MFNAHPLTSSRALEMLEMGEMSDCVIEVHEEQNGGQDKNKKVYFIIKVKRVSNAGCWPSDLILIG
jgi:hypothetical protein